MEALKAVTIALNLDCDVPPDLERFINVAERWSEMAIIFQEKQTIADFWVAVLLWAISPDRESFSKNQKLDGFLSGFIAAKYGTDDEG